MGTTYSSTVTVSCWKEHTCVACGQGYRYRFNRTKTAKASTAEAAQEAVRNTVAAALAKEVDMHACPGCGLYQPDMVGSQREKRHLWLLGIAGIPLALLLILGGTNVIDAAKASEIMAGIAAVAAVGHFLIEGINPNRNQEHNQRKAQLEIAGGLMESGGKTDAPAEGTNQATKPKSSLGLILCGAMGVAALAMISAELLRTVAGWPYNASSFPAVSGPGDTILIYFSDRFSSLKGYWKGLASVEILNATELGYAGPGFRATANETGWGQTISVKSSEKSSTFRPWAYIEIANAPQLAGKTVRMKIDMEISYPTIDPGGNSYTVRHQAISQIGDVRLAAPMAGETYVHCWWIGTVGGAIAVALLGFILSRMAANLRKQALPTAVTPCE